MPVTVREGPDPLPFQQGSQRAKDLAEWEQHDTLTCRLAGKSPGRPYVYRPFPKMLFKATQIPPGNAGAGKFAVFMPIPRRSPMETEQVWALAVSFAEEFTKANQCEVRDENELKARLESGEGWAEGPQEALAVQEVYAKAISDAAAERNWQDRRMSEKAKAESLAVESEHFGHLGEIKEQQIRHLAKMESATELDETPQSVKPPGLKRRGWPKGKPRKPPVT